MKILVFRIGQLGDTLVALPAMWAIRRHFHEAELSFLGDSHPARKLVAATDLLSGTGLFDNFLSYPVGRGAWGMPMRPFAMFGLWRELRRRNFDTLVYLAPSLRTAGQIRRDRAFFAAAGIRNFYGLKGFPRLPVPMPGMRMPSVAAEADLLLSRLAADGISVPSGLDRCFNLNLGETETQAVAAWRSGLPADGARPWIGVGPGSKMPAKRWPADRFTRVIKTLVKHQGVWPVVFGGPEDQAVGAEMIRHWGCGYNAAGALGVRAAAAALLRCRLYLGNDTGTMHLAAAMGVRCVAVFSARDHAGRWYPAGDGHIVFRSKVACEGCHLIECVERQNECLRLISPDTVLAGCQAVLAGLPINRDFVLP